MAKLIRRFEDGVGFVCDYTGPHYDESTLPYTPLLGRAAQEPSLTELLQQYEAAGQRMTPMERAIDRWADDGGYCPPSDER